jgi:hypothetical protein
MDKGSLPKPITWGSKKLIFYGETILMKLLKDFTASILTSISGSFNKLP